MYFQHRIYKEIMFFNLANFVFVVEVNTNQRKPFSELSEE